eukprot:TRINITY_DN25707_c0_g1_i3.p1 TRINITY_DN25707_c0_g1~~TRINITY_DN25707_c0_g1_i3.p1  ORF type:complete len:432 (-),score=90.62 TRINITY_DN25707_c0_g1_i3:62-1357(-)
MLGLPRCSSMGASSRQAVALVVAGLMLSGTPAIRAERIDGDGKPIVVGHDNVADHNVQTPISDLTDIPFSKEKRIEDMNVIEVQNALQLTSAKLNKYARDARALEDAFTRVDSEAPQLPPSSLLALGAHEQQQAHSADAAAPGQGLLELEASVAREIAVKPESDVAVAVGKHDGGVPGADVSPAVVTSATNGSAVSATGAEVVEALPVEHAAAVDAVGIAATPSASQAAVVTPKIDSLPTIALDGAAIASERTNRGVNGSEAVSVIEGANIETPVVVHAEDDHRSSAEPVVPSLNSAIDDPAVNATGESAPKRGAANWSISTDHLRLSWSRAGTSVVGSAISHMLKDAADFTWSHFERPMGPEGQYGPHGYDRTTASLSPLRLCMLAVVCVVLLFGFWNKKGGHNSRRSKDDPLLYVFKARQLDQQRQALR